MPPPVRLTDRATRTLDDLRASGHSIAWGRGSDGRTNFYWARITPNRTSAIRVAKAPDGDSLMGKVTMIIGEDPATHLIAGFADPLRFCPRCNTETSFDEDGPVVFACAADQAHLTVRPY